MRTSAATGNPGPARVVALGGGHGLAASLRALRHLTNDLTAVVTVADDGGSSGALRQRFDVLPPGDLRMALAALCDDSEWGRTWRDVLQHRIPDAEGVGHAVGNYLIVALWQLLGDHSDHSDQSGHSDGTDWVAGLDWVGRLLRATGRVLPMASVPLAIEADITRIVDGAEWRTTIHGQRRVALAEGRVEEIRLVPPDAPACPQAVAAIERADWVVLGPGSWFTSVIPHLMIPELAAAIGRPGLRRCVTLNLATQQGETSGYTAANHLEALARYSAQMGFDVVIADPAAVDDVGALAKCAESLGARLILRQVRLARDASCHDAVRLAAAYRDAFDGFVGDVGERSGGWER